MHERYVATRRDIDPDRLTEIDDLPFPAGFALV